MKLLIIVGIILIIVKCLTNRSNKESQPGKTKAIEENTSDDQLESGTKDYSNSYQRKYLLTKNEWHEYKKLKEIAASKNLQVFPKVRLLDIVEPRRGRRTLQKSFL